MEILDLRTVPAEPVSQYGSTEFAVASVGRVEGGHLALVRLGPGGRIGRHPAVGHQLLLLISGDATVSGQNRVEMNLEPGQAAMWTSGESHLTVSAAGMTAFVVEGDLRISP